ncbi:hypothetical protein GTP23_11525 [Pseudoduganella sp. FT93W]|uniref:Uncharacterized protein n=1 Tax=Duganella fentianensis TaxID=2692177 RepID=A0A845HXG2_9BURK|nr:hypothetical protein [Duganella fentianensis]MYN45679.1 hypothetical protein [Duganella fentianensis]
MIRLHSAQYALQRQRLAVQRVLYARTPEESALAARWACAWHRAVQRQLAHVRSLSRPASSSYGSSRQLH